MFFDHRRAKDSESQVLMRDSARCRHMYEENLSAENLPVHPVFASEVRLALRPSSDNAPCTIWPEPDGSSSDAQTGGCLRTLLSGHRRLRNVTLYTQCLANVSARPLLCKKMQLVRDERSVVYIYGLQEVQRRPSLT